MTATGSIHIQVNTKKFAGLQRLSIYAIVFGLFLVSRAALDQSIFLIILAVFGMATLIFFSPFTFFLFKKMKDRRSGITIDNSGITDNTILFSTGYIPWSDVQEIKKTGQLLVISVADPGLYISRQKNFIKRRMMKWMFKTYGSPVVITSNELEIDFDKLQNILQQEFEKNKL